MLDSSQIQTRWVGRLTLWIGLIFICLPNLDGQETGSWKFYRGENFDGHSAESGIVGAWPDKGPPVLWTRDLGAGYSSFVGSAGRVYTQYQSLSGQYVICLDATSGKTIWKHRYAWPYQPASLYPGPRSTPTISGNRLFFTTPRGVLTCLDLMTGEPVWSVDAARKFAAPEVEFGFACSPVCSDGRVFLPVGGDDSSMVAFDEANGDVIWQSGNEAISYCPALPISLDGIPMVIGYFRNSLCLFHREDGKLLAKVSVSDSYDEHSAWPIYREPYLWISGPFRAGSHLFELVREKDSQRVRLQTVYRTESMSNDVASSTLIGDAIYGFDIRDVQSKVHRPSRGQFSCMDFKSGDVLWVNGTLGRRKSSDLENGREVVASQQVSQSDEVGHASVIHADNKLILLNDTGELILGAVNEERFVETARANVLGGEIVWTQPALMDRCLFVRNHSRAVCVFLGDPAEIANAGAHVQFASELAQPAYLDLAGMILGTEPKYAMTAPKFGWLFQWFAISLVLGWIVAPALAFLIIPGIPGKARRPVFLMLTLFLGILGTTIAGHWLAVFYFSWPMALAIIFEIVVCNAESKSNPTDKPWVDRVWLVVFAIVCLAYFLLCRRLSLAFEWAFLMGFPAAVPFLWWMRRRDVQPTVAGPMVHWLPSLLAFSAFYWMGAGVILWKYGS